MIMLTLPESEVRKLVNMLLVQMIFDDFDLRSCTIQSFARFDIEGVVPGEPNPEVSETPGRKASFCKWQRIRPYVYNIIKGSEKPRFLKFVLSGSEELLTKDFPDAQALFINIIFDKNTVHITTGASMKTFSLDRSVENLWDGYIINFLTSNNLTIHEERYHEPD